MSFFVVTAAIMAVSILLIYKLCRFFGLELKWISLVLCAMMAFGVNGATIMLSPFLDQGHYFKLTALVLLAAALVTLINEYLLKRDHRQLAVANGAVLTVEDETEEKDTVDPKAEMLMAAAEDEESSAAGEKLSQRLQEAMKANLPPEESISPPEEEAEQQPEAVVEAPVPEEPAAIAPAEEPAISEEPSAPEPKIEAEAESEPEVEAEAKPEPEPKVELEVEAEPAPEQESAPTTEPEPVQEPESEPVVEDVPAEETTEPLPEEEPSRKDAPPTVSWEPDEAEAAVAALSSLDEILDFAYSNKEKNVNAAITAYRAAIDRYPEDSYTPFLIIELAGLYKERASYSEAINLYAESLGMPIIAGDDAMVQEFSKTLRYLGTVQDILNKHHALATPFSKLTPEILSEIEEEFARRQAKKSM